MNAETIFVIHTITSFIAVGAYMVAMILRIRTIEKDLAELRGHMHKIVAHIIKKEANYKGGRGELHIVDFSRSDK